MTRCVLVRSVEGTRWGFPKGKLEAPESELKCAVREVFEEVGFGIGQRVEESARISVQWQGKAVRLALKWLFFLLVGGV